MDTDLTAVLTPKSAQADNKVVRPARSSKKVYEVVIPVLSAKAEDKEMLSNFVAQSH